MKLRNGDLQAKTFCGVTISTCFSVVVFCFLGEDLMWGDNIYQFQWGGGGGG